MSTFQLNRRHTITHIIGSGLLTGILMSSTSSAALAASTCENVRIDASSLAIDAACVLFDGKRYQTKWLAATAGGSLGWLLDPMALEPSSCPATVANCSKLDDNFNLTFRDAEINGRKFNINLKPVADPSSPLGMRWDYTTHSSATIHSKIGSDCSVNQRTQRISFVHVGDLHARFDLVQDKYSKIRAYFDKVKLENSNTVFTNAGDDLAVSSSKCNGADDI